jgi:hypothetical protein
VTSKPTYVGKSEVDAGAVAGSEVKDGSIKPADLHAAAAGGTAAWTTTLSDPPATRRGSRPSPHSHRRTLQIAFLP